MAGIVRRRDKPKTPVLAAFLATLQELRPVRAYRRAGSGIAAIALSLALHIMMCDCDGNGEEAMATNLALDDKLIEEAVRVGGHRTKKAAVTAALTEYVKSRRRQRILRWKGQVRQEILSGIRRPDAFEALQNDLSNFPYLTIDPGDYDRAAEFFNACRAHGIPGGPIDMLISAVACRHDVPLFAADPDYVRYARHVPLRLHRPRQAV